MPWILYYISLIPLFIYLFIKYFDSKVYCLLKLGEYNNLTYGNYAFMVSFLLFIVSVILISILKYCSRKKFNIHGAKITTAPQNINHELIGVLSTVVLPFLTVNFDTANEVFASIFMLLIIGVISTRSTIYYKNPVLAILYLKIYQVEIEHKSLKNNLIVNVISFHSLTKDDSLYLKEMGEGVYYAKKTSNG
ncbi:hypothetical protein DMA11_16085 [Marinilabiliaceae bacterium JC017]|nr:hypothetical protein DMA11_16085 [Marinilabiliaceae bacterium JC017]